MKLSFDELSEPEYEERGELAYAQGYNDAIREVNAALAASGIEPIGVHPGERWSDRVPGPASGTEPTHPEEYKSRCCHGFTEQHEVDHHDKYGHFSVRCPGPR